MAETILRLPDVIRRTGCSRSAIYLKKSRGEFPAPIMLGVRSVGWLQSEVEKWINVRIEVSRTFNETKH